MSMQVWAGPLSEKRVVVVLWNRRDSYATISLARNEVGLPSSIPLVVRDLWEVLQTFVLLYSFT